MSYCSADFVSICIQACSPAGYSGLKNYFELHLGLQEHLKNGELSAWCIFMVTSNRPISEGMILGAFLLSSSKPRQLSLCGIFVFCGL